MSSVEQHYDFLPEGWYFIVEEEDEYDETRLYTASGVEVAWLHDNYSCKIQILKGMEHEAEFIQSLFDQKLIKDKYDQEQEDRAWQVKRANEDREKLAKVRNDFENINRPQPAVLSLSESSKELDSQIKQFKQKWF